MAGRGLHCGCLESSRPPTKQQRGHTAYMEPDKTSTDQLITLRNDAFRKAVNHAKEFIHGSQL